MGTGTELKNEVILLWFGSCTDCGGKEKEYRTHRMMEYRTHRMKEHRTHKMREYRIQKKQNERTQNTEHTKI